MRNFIEIGSAPNEADCAQTGRPGAQELNRLECRAYVVALTLKYGKPPEGARYIVHPNNHELGTYYEVRCVYETDIPEASAYAFRTENGLDTWDEVGMWPPVTYDERGRAVNTITDPDLWLKETNPGAYPTKEQRDANKPAEPPD